MAHHPSLIAELENAIEGGSKDRRIDALRRITDLFVADAERFTDQQIEVFDDVLGQLIKRIEGKALAELSQRLGHVGNAPIEVVRRLAKDDDIAIAEPILRQSGRLTDHDLIDIANTKTQQHLLAIATRAQIASNVTDALLRRGSPQVFHKLAENAGANFTERGFATLVHHSERDEHLAERVGLRLDIPLKLFRELLLRATEAVRTRLLAVAGSEGRDRIQRMLVTIADEAEHEASFQTEQDFAAAHARMLRLKSKGHLNESTLLELARSDRYADMIAALSLLCDASVPLIENLLHSEHREAWLIPCKVAGLGWPTVRAMLNCRVVGRAVTDQTNDTARADYYRLSRASAARVLRFWQVRQSASTNAIGSA